MTVAAGRRGALLRVDLDAGRRAAEASLHRARLARCAAGAAAHLPTPAWLQHHCILAADMMRVGPLGAINSGVCKSIKLPGRLPRTLRRAAPRARPCTVATLRPTGTAHSPQDASCDCAGLCLGSMASRSEGQRRLFAPATARHGGDAEGGPAASAARAGRSKRLACHASIQMTCLFQPGRFHRHQPVQRAPFCSPVPPLTGPVASTGWAAATGRPHTRASQAFGK